MAKYAGSALYATWICAAGTIVLSGSQTEYSNNLTRDQYDASAGSDAYRTYVAGIMDHTHSLSAKHDAGGTALMNALRVAANQIGTLIVAPEGTASTKPKETYPVNVNSLDNAFPYDNVVTISVSFQGNGAPTYGQY